jgi:two-component system, NarL family, invasion response regulator UvrY
MMMMDLYSLPHEDHSAAPGSANSSAIEHTKRILLVDDHPVVRQGIRQILTEAFPVVQIGEAEHADEALTALRTSGWDIIVLDIAMPGVTGLELLREIRRERPALPVLILSMHPAEQFASRAMLAGASAYLTKHSGPGELVEAIEALTSGKVYVSPHADAGESPESRDSQPPSAHEKLSDREYQVLRMIAQGKTVSQIAAEISLSVKTVSTYRARVLEKMNMRTTAELMRYAIVNRLVD